MRLTDLEAEYFRGRSFTIDNYIDYYFMKIHPLLKDHISHHINLKIAKNNVLFLG